MIKTIQNKSFRQFIKFSIVGASGTAIDWIFYFICTRWLGIYYLLAKAISFILAAVNNYIWNRTWTFRSQEKRVFREFSKFFIVSIIGLGVNTFIMYLMVDRFKLYDFWGLIVATAIVLIWNFFANKLWTFKEKK